MDCDDLLRVSRAFQNQNLEYVLIGATAMGFHALVRSTEGVDLMIRPTPENIERLQKALLESYAEDPSIPDIRTEDLLGDYPAVKSTLRTATFFRYFDTAWEVASFDTIEAPVVEVEGVRVRVATPRSLYELKRNTVRPIDRQDAARLRERFQLKDE
jgi:hypothetical protein